MYVSHQQQRVVQQQRLREVSERNQTRPEGSRKHPHKEEQQHLLGRLFALALKLA
jgi:hypothetical protein